ncbi:hypothetical protein [Corynebacterium sp.]|uniref:hypothetical protein n=1 Tax=Corynebacterium sp. TaxID=1720 RepID=UPI0026DBB3F1|nr:hypothetical protein [Corynebacterium sp.]MDO5031127.1 hypothetical protein [Corynebacterium sp.]
MSSPSSPQRAGAFDLRNVIGALLGLYGIILLLCSFLLDPGINPENNIPKNSSDNLWAGLAMLAVAAIMMAWAYFKPIVVEEHPHRADHAAEAK